jgi:L,D-transpeptidase catalytic domain
MLGQVPDRCTQLIVATAPDWPSNKASAQCWQRADAADKWHPAFKAAWPVLLGRNGMAWGRGVFKIPRTDQPEKIEKDGRSPAGLFELGPVHGYAASPPQGTSWPYLQVGPFDAWIDDPKLPHYNEHVRVDPAHIPAWFASQKMRLGDNAYKWLLEIRHNVNPATPGFGSAIFFHVRRGPDRPTAGCTSMAVENLEALIGWLKPSAHPCYVLLPESEYEKLRKSWHLP